MNCRDARTAMLTAEPTDLLGQGNVDLARHLRECAACATVARELACDLRGLNETLVARSRRNRRLVLASLPVAAAVVLAILAAKATPSSRPQAIVRASAPIVSVKVARGTRATVFVTKDPKVTVVWISNEGGL